MILVQMTGLSGAGKSSIANVSQLCLTSMGYKVQILDGDDCRRHLCRDLGFSKVDRLENINRLGYVGLLLAKQGIITILAAINPYEEARKALKDKSILTKTVFIDCPLSATIERDSKGLYYKAFLPQHHPDHIAHFTGVSDPYEVPAGPDLVIKTHGAEVQASAKQLTGFILQCIGKEGK